MQLRRDAWANRFARAMSRFSPDGTRSSHRGVIFGLLAADVTFAFQQTAVVPAIPAIQRSLGGSPEWAAWMVTVYLIVATIATPSMGRLADLHGRRRLLLVGLAVFMAGSIGATLAPDMVSLLIFRAVQGVGGSVYPLSLALARRLLPGDLAARAIAWSAGSFGLGTIAGFAAGGALAQYISWRLIFGIGAVLVAAGFCSIMFLIPRTDEHAGGGFDVRGTTALGIASIGLLVALTLVVTFGAISPAVIGCLVLAGAAAVAWVRLETRVDDPLIDLHILQASPVLRANLASVALGWALFSTYLLVPSFIMASPGSAHYGLGGSTVQAGLIMVPLAVAQAVCSPLAGVISQRVDPRAVFVTGLLLTGAGLGWLSADHGGLAQTVAALAVLGAGAGAGLQSSSKVATQGVSDDVAAASSSLNSTVRRFAGGIGGQVATILLASAATASGGPPFSEFTTAYLVAAALCLAGAAVLIF